MTITKEQIEKRAYELYVASGCEERQALKHWLEAKLELVLESLESQQISNEDSERKQTSQTIPAQMFLQAAD